MTTGLHAARQVPARPDRVSGDTLAPALLLRGVSVRYPATAAPALDGVTLEVRRGETVAVAGRTGAGKSTVTLAAAGFIPRVVRARVDGEIVVEGVDAARASASDLLGRVGIVFATPANQLSASKLTVREELAFGLENLGVPRTEMDGRIDAVLARLGIAHLRDREPFALSGGEQQRVAIASIVAMGTRVLALDEPTAQLDPGGTSEVAELLAELALDGTAVLCAEHDPAVLARADRCLVLRAGRVAADGVPGAALGTERAAPAGLLPPTLVRLAEAARVPPEQAFDEAAIAHALSRADTRDGRVGRRRTAEDATADQTGAGGGWTPVTPREGVPIRIDGLFHRYPSGVEALRGVSVDMRAGETIAIVGQNGSGKTTLVKHLIGLLRPAAGRVRIGDLDATREPTHVLARTVGFAFQNPDDQLFERSVEREVAFGPRTLGFGSAETTALVDGAIEATGLSDVRSTNPYDLDLSRRKLVGLASVLAADPLVLVLDEPTTGQDGHGVATVGRIVEALRAAGRTVIAITHDMEFAAAHFGRILVLRQGEVVADGPPMTVFAPDRTPLLASTGLNPPPAARIAALIGLGIVPLTADDLLDAVLAR